MTRPPDGRPERPLWGPDVPRDVDDELADHLAEREAELLAQGLDPETARARAREKFGDVATVRRALVTIDTAREQARRRRDVLGDLGRDLRLAVRSMRRSPAFAVATILTLALGIGATIAVFSVVDAVLLRPLPYREPGRLVVAVQTASAGSAQPRTIVSWPDYLDWRDTIDAFDGAAALQTSGYRVRGPSGPELLFGGRVTASFFGVLGINLAQGRDFTSADDATGAAPVAIISHRLWRDRFGGAADVLGRSINLNDTPHEIVGVLPATFRSAFHAGGDADLWVPMAIGPGDMTRRESRWLRFVARLRDGATLAQARDRVGALSREAYRDSSDEAYRSGFTLAPIADLMVQPVRPALLAVAGAVGALLLIGCGNVSALLLARALANRRDLAIRTAIGAGRARLIRQLLTESLLLAGAGGALGLLFAGWSRPALLALAPAIPRLEEAAVNWRVVAFAVMVSLITGLVFGTWPAFRASRIDVVETLRSAGSGATAVGRRRRVLVAAEVALTLVLLVAGGLLVSSFRNLLRVDPGFRPGGVLTVSVSPEAGWSTERRSAFFEAITRRAAALPGASAAAFIDFLPIVGGFANSTHTVSEFVEGAVTHPDERIVVENRRASPEYFQVLQIPVVAGRAFLPSDTADAPGVAVLSRSLAHRLWGDENPLGRRVSLGRRGVTVVGVVGDVHHYGLARDAVYTAYRPLAQQPPAYTTLVVRSTSDPAGLVPLLRAAIRAEGPMALVREFRTLDEILAADVGEPRFFAFLVGSFAALASLLSAVGLFGLVAYLVAQRRREIGIRLALGAHPSRLRADVIRDGLAVTAAGLLFGLALTFPLGRVLGTLLFGLHPSDPLVLAAAALWLLVTALAACYVPARRVLRVDPVEALRAE